MQNELSIEVLKTDALEGIPHKPEIWRLRLDYLTIDPRLQSRLIKPGTINKYLEAMKWGEVFPPVLVVLDPEQTYYLVDGHHRVAAAKQLVGIDLISAEIVRGSFDKALWLSLGANRDHGLPRTQKEKRRAIFGALRHPIWGKESNRAIGDHVGCDHKTVAKMRQQLASGEFPTPGESASKNATKDGVLRACRSLARVRPDQPVQFGEEEMRTLQAAREVLAQLITDHTSPLQGFRLTSQLQPERILSQLTTVR